MGRSASGYAAGILIKAASGPALGSWLAAALVVIFSLPFHFCSIALSRRIEFFRKNLRAIRITLRGSDGGSSRAFGENLTWERMLLTEPGRCHLREEASEPMSESVQIFGRWQ